MDPLSQGLVGACLAQSFSGDKQQKVAFVAGLLSGMAADLDIFISSSEDSLLAIEFHRHFTHSLVFVPVGAFAIAALLHGFVRRHLPFWNLFVMCLLGFFTHGLLDACTSYGTQLLWPFSNRRVAWDCISIVDPLFTLPLLIAVVTAAYKMKSRWALVGLVYALCYLSFGVLQRERALQALNDEIASRPQVAQRLVVKPALGSLFLFRAIVESDDTFEALAIHTGLTPKIYPGSRLPRWKTPTELTLTSRLATDINRFRWFSDDFLVVHPEFPNIIADFRYAMLPNSVSPLWGIVIEPSRPNEHVKFVSFRRSENGTWDSLWKMIQGR